MNIRKTKPSTQCSNTAQSADAGAIKPDAKGEIQLGPVEHQTLESLADAEDFVQYLLGLPYAAAAREASGQAVQTDVNLLRYIYGLPHADVLRGERAGVEWACKVEKILGPRFQQKMREVVNEVHVDSENILFLATIHSGCFGRVLDADYPKIHMAEYMRGFLIGVRKNQEEASAGA